MITQAHFKNFKLLRDVSLDLGRLNVIVGRNGVGKSSVLEGLHLHFMGVSRRYDAIYVGPHAISRLLAKPDATELEFNVTLNTEFQYQLQVSPVNGSNEGYRFDYGFAPNPSRPGLQLSPESDQSHLGAKTEELFWRGPRAAGLSSISRLCLNSVLLSAEHYSEDERPHVGSDGEGLASVLQYLQGLRDGIMEAIEGDLSVLVPGIRRIRTLPVKIQRQEKLRVSVNGQDSWASQSREMIGARFEVEFEGTGWIPADQLSEGTLLALGLLTVLHHNAPRLLLLDDLDKALHPVAQRGLVALLKKLLNQKPDLQIIATAHSPFVLDELEPDQVFIAGALSPTASQIRRLTDHPSWAKRSGYMHPGEFWSAVGEGWVAEEKP